MINFFYWLKNFILSIRFGQTPKYIRVGNDKEFFDIPCHKKVVDFLVFNKSEIDDLLKLKKYHLANLLVFGFLKDYVAGIEKYSQSSEDYSEVLYYILSNIE